MYTFGRYTTSTTTHDLVSCWFFFNWGSNSERNVESLDLIYSTSVGEEKFVKFEIVFYAVIYIWAPMHLKIE